VAALHNANLKDAPRGPVTIDDRNNPTENIYVLKVAKVNGRLTNVPIYTFKNVSLFWHYKPEDILAQPPYSREYPPCKNCLSDKH
jgi:branched-chain amino acid transport system substrate-binding protein